MTGPRLIPELEVRDLARSLNFYVARLGFAIAYQRLDDGFAYLTLDEAHLMLEQIGVGGRRFVNHAEDQVLGAGLNLQIEVEDVDQLLKRLRPAADEIVLATEDAWYATDRCEVGNRQFVVRDPDGYLLRFFTDLGERAK